MGYIVLSVAFSYACSLNRRHGLHTRAGRCLLGCTQKLSTREESSPARVRRRCAAFFPGSPIGSYPSNKSSDNRQPDIHEPAGGEPRLQKVREKVPAALVRISSSE